MPSTARRDRFPMAETPQPLAPLAVPETLPDLSVREQLLVRALLSGATPVDACRQAGYAETTALRKSAEICDRGPIRSAIADAMAAAGITTERLAEVMAAGLDAKDGDGDPEWIARHKFLETCLRVGGHNPPKEATLELTYEERITRLRAHASPELSPPSGEVEGDTV